MRIWFLLLSAIIFSACSSTDTKQKAQASFVMPPLAVQTTQVTKEPTTLLFEYPATVKSTSKVNVRPKIKGVLLKKYYTEGSFVKKGDILYKIEDDKYKIALQTAQANLDLANAKLKEALSDENRTQRLFNQKALSSRELELAQTKTMTAKANKQSALAMLENANIDLSYTKITAPISGITSLSTADIGNTVDPSLSLTSITRLDPINVEFSLPSKERTFLQQNFNDINTSLLNPAINGKLDYLGVVIDEATSTVTARAVFDNKDSLILPGEFVRIKLATKTKQDYISIDQKHVLQEPKGAFVYLAKDGKALKQKIEIAQENGSFFLVQSGLNSGDEIITTNLIKLRDGADIVVSKK